MQQNKGQGYFGSINFDKLIADLKKGKLKTYRTDKGDRLINIAVWINENPDEYGNIGSVAVPYKEEFQQEKQKKIFIGNIKKSAPTITEVGSEAFPDEEDDDLPF